MRTTKLPQAESRGWVVAVQGSGNVRVSLSSGEGMLGLAVFLQLPQPTNDHSEMQHMRCQMDPRSHKTLHELYGD